MSDQKLPEVRPPQPLQTFTDEQKQLLLNTVAKGATPDEFKLFLYRCTNLRLDPLKPGQAHFVKIGSGPGVFVVGIDGFRAIAGRTGLHCGTARGVLRDDNGKLIGAWAEVDRKDWRRPAREEVSFAEYNTGRSAWAKLPESMIKKVAEVAALRMAFPDDLGGVYESAEMDQATAGPREVQEPAPAPRTVTAAPEPNFDPPEPSAIVQRPSTLIKKLSQPSPPPNAAPKGKNLGELIQEHAAARGIPMDVLSDYRRHVLGVPDGERPTEAQMRDMLNLVKDETTDLKLVKYLIATASGGEPDDTPF